MKATDARALARQFSITEMQPGDRVMSPRGEEMYRQLIVMPGQSAFAFMYRRAPVGVVVIRRGETGLLRYCDREGRIHQEEILADTRDQTMGMAINRMAVVVSQFLGERHPLAEAAAANRMSA